MILELRPTDETSKLVAEIFAALDGNQKFQLTVIEKKTKRHFVLFIRDNKTSSEFIV